MITASRKMLQSLIAISTIVAGISVLAVRAEAPAADDTEKLARERQKVAKEAYDLCLARVTGGAGADAQGVYFWSERILTAELEMSTNDKERIAAHQGHFDRMLDFEKTTARALRRDYRVVAAEYFRIDAELRLARAKSK